MTFPITFPFSYYICHSAQKKHSLRYKKQNAKTYANVSVSSLPVLPISQTAKNNPSFNKEIYLLLSFEEEGKVSHLWRAT